MVLYFGFNDRDEPRSEILKRDVRSLLEKTYEAFTRAHIFISWIGSSEASAKNFWGFKMPRGAFSREKRAFFLSFVLLSMTN